MKINIFNSEKFIFFTTRDYAQAHNLSLSAASKQLSRLGKKQSLQMITRGIWANVAHPYFNPLAAVPYLLGPEQGYVSFLTALHQHGVISQIPATIQVATTGHARSLATPIGKFEFFQLKPEMMRDGIDWSESKCPYRIAGPEKALLDTRYLATRKGRRFAALPELDLSRIRTKVYASLLKQQITSLRIRNAINCTIVQ